MVKEVAQHFRVSESAIPRLRTKYRQRGTIKDRPRPGRPRKTTRHEGNFIVTSSRHNRFLSSTGIVVCLQLVIVVFSDHTHLLFWLEMLQEHGYVLRL